MNTLQFGEVGKNKWVCVQAVFVDERDILRVVDPAAPLSGKVADKSYKLIAFDLNKNEKVAHYNFQGKFSDNSYVNDVRIDYSKNLAYLTNSNEGGIVVVDLKDSKIVKAGKTYNYPAGETREFFKNNFSVLSDKEYKFKPNKGNLCANSSGPRYVNSDGITISKDNKNLFYKPLTDNILYDFLDLYYFDSSDEIRISQVKNWGKVSTADENEKIYFGDLENDAIVVFDPNTKQKSILVQDIRLQWPDSFSFYKGYLYVSCSQIHNQPQFNNGINKRATPYEIFKIKIN